MNVRYHVYRDTQRYWVVMKHLGMAHQCWGLYSSAQGAWSALRQIGW